MTVKIDGTNTVANPAFTGADTDTGLQCGTDELKLVTGGTARATVDSSGDVMIGTTSNTAHSDADNLIVGSTGGTHQGVTINGSTSSQIRFADSGSNTAGYIIYSHSTDSLQFATNGTERVRIHGDGTLAVPNGILLDPSQLSGSSANILDDYEEGTFIPTITGQTQGTATLDASVNTLAYTKIGRVVFLTGRIRVTSVSGVSGNLRLGNLPFPNVSNLSDHADYGLITITGYKLDLPADAAGPTRVELAPGFSDGTLIYTRDDASWPPLPVNSLDSGDTYLHVQGRYLVNA